MAETLRYGVIGTGMMGIEHIKNLALLPGAALVAFADPHEESRRWARLAAGSAREYSDCRRLPSRLHLLRAPAVEIGAAAEQSARERRPIELGGST